MKSQLQECFKRHKGEPRCEPIPMGRITSRTLPMTGLFSNRRKKITASLWLWLVVFCTCLPKPLPAQQAPPVPTQQAQQAPAEKDKDKDENEEVVIPQHESIVLSHEGAANVRFYVPDEKPPRAVIVFGSGDGGWSAWEDAVSRALMDDKILVLGFDCRAYSKSDYNAATMGKDWATLAKEAVDRSGAPDISVIYGGWSMGAVQAVAAAGYKDRAKNLKGLYLLGADDRGRYGLRPQDETGLVTPKGPGTFGLGDFTKNVANLRVAQFHGGADFMASTAWIHTLKTKNYALYVIPGANHGFDGPSQDFFDEGWLNRGIDWVLGDDSAKAAPPHFRMPFNLSPMWPAGVVAVGLIIVFLISRTHSLRLLSFAIFLMGLVDLTEAIYLKPPLVIAWMERWVPLGVTEKSRLLLMFSGLSLLALARGLGRHKRMAWVLTLIMLVVTAILHLSRAFDWHHAMLAIVLLFPLVRWRKEFVARSDASSLKLALQVAAVVLVGLMAYGTTGMHQFSARGNLGQALTWDESASRAASAVFLQKTEYDLEGNRNVRRFLETLRGGSLLGGLIVIALLLRPVLERRLPEATEDERSRVKDIIAKHGRDPMDTFALLTDKRYFFTSDGEGVVAYSLWRKFAVALADPVCPPDKRNEAIHDFSRFCKQQDWEPVFYCAHVANRAAYEEEGLVTFKVGEDARLSVGDFKLEGGKFQNLRTARNKARKNGLTMQWYQATPQIDHGLEAQLQLLSQDWLNRKHGGEMTFDLGSFDLKEIHERGAAIVRNPEGRIEAFATWRPYDQGKGRCLDLMRGREEARDVMDFLIVEAVDHFKAEGVEEVSLGNAPLANVDADTGLLESRQERAVKFLFDNFDRYYGYKSLFNFKKKYQPEWQGRFLAYRPRASLAMVGLAIAGVHLPRGFMGLLRS